MGEMSRETWRTLPAAVLEGAAGDTLSPLLAAGVEVDAADGAPSPLVVPDVGWVALLAAALLKGELSTGFEITGGPLDSTGAAVIVVGAVAGAFSPVVVAEVGGEDVAAAERLLLGAP